MSIEVEKKFSMSPLVLKRIEEHPNCEKKGEHSFFDTYYDRNFELTTDNIWLRKREDLFELKVGVRKKGSSIDGYREIQAVEEIRQILSLGSLSMDEALLQANIVPFCKFKTQRNVYQIHRFKIDVDHAQFTNGFTYSVAEIELMVEKEDVDAAEKQIIDFACSIEINPEEIVRAKLVAFLEKNKKDHYEALIKAGVIS